MYIISLADPGFAVGGGAWLRTDKQKKKKKRGGEESASS